MIAELPQGFGTVQMLEYLDLSCNKLTAISANFGYLTTLKELHMADNLLTALPKEIGNLTGLETLVLRDNKLKTLPDEFGKLTNLLLLNLQGNEFEKLPSCLLEIPLDRREAKLLLADNPFDAETKAVLKKGGVPTLFAAMREPSWGKTAPKPAK
eukprot:jgi/Hompol1/2095/HPOL_003561-RA